METPLCADGVYRALTDEQAARVVNENPHLDWVLLQKQLDKDSKVVNQELDSCQSLPQRLSMPPLKSWEDTAAIIAHLDLVVTVDTGVMHLAAAMGKPTWVILSGAVDWKFGLQGEKCLWYPTMRLFRNNDFGFENSVDEVIHALKAPLP